MNLVPIFIGIIFFCAYDVQIKNNVPNHNNDLKSNIESKVEGSNIQSYTGWWIYGEGQHLFKDEKTLNEYTLKFPNENMQELQALYLAVCEMEYFPMESMLDASMKIDHIDGKKILVVYDFEILYIEGCGE